MHKINKVLLRPTVTSWSNGLFHSIAMRERHTDVSQPPPKSSCPVAFHVQTHMLPISMTNKQSGRDVLEHRLSGPRYCFAPWKCHIPSLSLPPPHQSRPQSHTGLWCGGEGFPCELLLRRSHTSHPGEDRHAGALQTP